ncbi:MAG: DUF2974 domain-containing protein [Clostridiales bacterium]|nr:DUF2974 domain-containing protein [Clostridiales bacterium]
MAGISTSNEAQISAMLNLFEYLDYHMGEPGQTLRELVEDADQYLQGLGLSENDSRREMVSILKEGMDSIPGLEDLRLAMSEHGKGIEADAFVSDSRDAYVVYRGTGDGKWIDNGRGMTSELTASQEQATEFFDRVARECGLDDFSNIVVTGHSKGGNNAQTATMNADNRMLIDRCYSFDGQGMSDAAIERYKSMPGYEEQRRKMYGINGENDVVNELGTRLIPDENEVYIETNSGSSELMATHSLQYLYYREDGTFGYLLNEETRQGALGRYAHRLSEILMSLPEDMRDSCAVSIMQLIELGEENMVGYDGDHATFSDMAVFWNMGIPVILYSLIGTEEGRTALIDLISDQISKSIEEIGMLPTAGIVLAAVMLAPVIIPRVFPMIIGFLAEITIVVNLLAGLEKLKELMEEIWSYIQECLDAIEEFFEEIGEWIRSKVTGRPVIDYADFSVDANAMRYAADEMESMYYALQRAASGIHSIRRSLPMHGIAAGAVKSYMDYVTLQICLTGGRADRMKQVLNRSAAAYERSERKIVENAPA